MFDLIKSLRAFYCRVFIKKTLVLIDGNNLNGMQDTLQMSIDFYKLFGFLKNVAKQKSVDVAYCVGHKDQAESKNAEKFLKILASLGYEVLSTIGGQRASTLIQEKIAKSCGEYREIILVGNEFIYAEVLREVDIPTTIVGVTFPAEFYATGSTIVNLADYVDEIIDRIKTRERYRENSPNATWIDWSRLSDPISTSTKPPAAVEIFRVNDNEFVIRVRIESDDKLRS